MQTSLIDLAPITRHLRAKATSHLLAAAVHHLNVFEEVGKSSGSLPELQQRLALKSRPAMVLFPALCAMGLLQFNPAGCLELTPLGRYLTSAEPSNLTGYTSLEKDDPGTLRMAQWLKNDGPENEAEGFSYVKDDKAPSPMDDPAAASFFTMALAGRARYLAPVVAANVTKRSGHLLDVAGGSGYYSFEWLLANPGSQATIFDRPEVLKVAEKLLHEYCSTGKSGTENLKDRVHFVPGDMLTDELPSADILLAASLFHDWPEETCELLARKFAAALNPSGELWIHDAFLDDTIDGPLAITDYSAMLFLGTRGRAYSRKEYRGWLTAAGLIPSLANIPTLMDYGLIWARKE